MKISLSYVNFSWPGSGAESAASFVDRCGRFAEWGIDHACVITSGPWTDEGIATLGAAVPQVADL